MFVQQSGKKEDFINCKNLKVKINFFCNRVVKLLDFECLNNKKYSSFLFKR